MLHRANHEVDDGLRSIDDAMRIGNFYCKTLEKLLIDRIEEALLLRPFGDRLRPHLQHDIKMIERCEELMAIEASRGERIDDLFDLACDDVAAHEFGIIEDSLEDP